MQGRNTTIETNNRGQLCDIWERNIQDPEFTKVHEASSSDHF